MDLAFGRWSFGQQLASASLQSRVGLSNDRKDEQKRKASELRRKWILPKPLGEVNLAAVHSRRSGATNSLMKLIRCGVTLDHSASTRESDGHTSNTRPVFVNRNGKSEGKEIKPRNKSRLRRLKPNELWASVVSLENSKNRPIDNDDNGCCQTPNELPHTPKVGMRRSQHRLGKTDDQ
ncbi:unnamed protein product [Soboliphyme baturini]|uniref:Uncharacterized protein n=1 Tax=Soboliphyme baturini TaxID=241478 RepID=A0A183J5H7_9BILA|nr:unnamed protein product [Soboliphyme baturini]